MNALGFSIGHTKIGLKQIINPFAIPKAIVQTVGVKNLINPIAMAKNIVIPTVKNIGIKQLINPMSLQQAVINGLKNQPVKSIQYQNNGRLQAPATGSNKTLLVGAAIGAVILGYTYYGKKSVKAKI
jgi:hypothetical protein